MNTKKADWSYKPAFEDITLHSYRWYNRGRKTAVFFTLGETEDCRLQCDCDSSLSYSFMLFHTPSDIIRFSPSEGIDARLFGAAVSMPAAIGNDIELRKSGPSLRFYSGGKLILSTEDPAFGPSASLAFCIEGEGNAYMEVF